MLAKLELINDNNEIPPSKISNHNGNTKEELPLWIMIKLVNIYHNYMNSALAQNMNFESLRICQEEAQLACKSFACEVGIVHLIDWNSFILENH